MRGRWCCFIAVGVGIIVYVDTMRCCVFSNGLLILFKPLSVCLTIWHTFFLILFNRLWLGKLYLIEPGEGCSLLEHNLRVLDNLIVLMVPAEEGVDVRTFLKVHVGMVLKAKIAQSEVARKLEQKWRQEVLW